MSEGMLVRYDENGARQELAMDYAAILDGRQPDFPVRNNDIIFVPGSAAKTIGYGMVNMVPRLLQSTLIYGLIF
jgi:hypothetical protein